MCERLLFLCEEGKRKITTILLIIQLLLQQSNSIIAMIHSNEKCQMSNPNRNRIKAQ